MFITYRILKSNHQEQYAVKQTVVPMFNGTGYKLYEHHCFNLLSKILPFGTCFSRNINFSHFSLHNFQINKFIVSQEQLSKYLCSCSSIPFQDQIQENKTTAIQNKIRQCIILSVLFKHLLTVRIIKTRKTFKNSTNTYIPIYIYILTRGIETRR